MENHGFVSGPGGIRVLVVEEDPSDLTALTQMLQRHGYKVTAKASPEEGLTALQDNPEGFDLVMSVIHTQGTGIDGFELLRLAKNRHPVILFSDNEPKETVMRAMVDGACDYIDKPLRDDVMRNIFQHVLRRQMHAASRAAANSDDARISDVVVRQDDTVRKTGSAALYDSDEADSHSIQQQKRARTTKTTMFNSPTQLNASIVRAAEHLRGTEVIDVVEKKEESGEHIPPHCQEESKSGSD